jgi:carbonic anhydrase/acetyltransferase-like protein (isoleucine patch superfamily)
MILRYLDAYPKIHPSVFIAPNATIIGDVTLEEGVSVWYGAVLRGDMAPIYIGKSSNIQDNATIHTSENHPVWIGKEVTVGHNAVIHGCKIDDHSLIGIGAVILDGAIIQKGTVIAASSLVKERESFDEDSLVAGVPAVQKKRLDPKFRESRTLHANVYVEMGNQHKELVREH